MQAQEIIENMENMARLNPLTAVSVVIILAFLLFRKTKMFFILLACGIGAIVVMSLFERLSETGL